jgi:phospholipid/cholesterol/gamma-HCH transport system ATP-binding protein
MSDNGPILVFRNVTVAAGGEWDCGIRNATFELGAGEILLLRLEPGRTRIPLADAAGGLAGRPEGAVSFMGEDWQSMSPDRAAACRGRIGRVFESRGWISNLDIDENVTLSQRYHRSRPLCEIVEEAEALAREFGLPGLPKARRTEVPLHDLRRAEWVRAFLGGPDLIILERPTRDVRPEGVPALAGAVRAALDRGAAVICTVGNEGGAPDVAPVVCREYAMRGPELVPL